MTAYLSGFVFNRGFVNVQVDGVVLGVIFSLNIFAIYLSWIYLTSIASLIPQPNHITSSNSRQISLLMNLSLMVAIIADTLYFKAVLITASITQIVVSLALRNMLVLYLIIRAAKSAVFFHPKGKQIIVMTQVGILLASVMSYFIRVNG